MVSTMRANLGRPATLRTLVKTSRRTRLLMLACVLLTAALATHAQTKMFKCIIDARTVYQQTGCLVGSLADDVKPIAGTAAASGKARTHVQGSHGYHEYADTAPGRHDRDGERS